MVNAHPLTDDGGEGGLRNSTLDIVLPSNTSHDVMRVVKLIQFLLWELF